MRFFLRVAFANVCIWILLLGASSLFAQADGGDRGSSSDRTDGVGGRSARPVRLKAGTSQLTIWSGVSFDSPSRTFIGATENRDFVVAGLQYGLILASGKRIAFEYIADFIPLAIVTNNPQAMGSSGNRPRLARNPVYGFGATPVGFKLYFKQTNALRFFLNGGGGFLAFKREVPVPRARRFNFTFEFGAGVQVSTASRWALSVGYKLHHLSNANTAYENPGLDANIFYLGFSAFR